MRAIGYPPPSRPGFGNPDAVTFEAFESLPPAGQAEAVRLLAEMGQSGQAISRRLGLTPREVYLLATSRHQPIKPACFVENWG